jgi:hypothetical protein
LAILRSIRSNHGYAVYLLALDRVLKELMAEPVPASVAGETAGPQPWVADSGLCEVCELPGHPVCGVYWCQCPCKGAATSGTAA